MTRYPTIKILSRTVVKVITINQQECGEGGRSPICPY